MKKKKIIIAVVVLVILGVVLIFLNQRVVREQESERIKTEEERPEEEIEDRVIDESVEVIEEQYEEIGIDLHRKARNFIERAGSFSSDSQDLNLQEIKGTMTNSLFEKLQSDLQKILAENKNGFYGQTTKMISLEQIEFEADISARFKAMVQIQKTKGDVSEIVYQTQELAFLKQADKWLAAEMTSY